jgi:hypothetical protein
MATEADTRGKTRPVQGEGGNGPSPRLPHEHDESSDSQRNGVRPEIKRAHDDLAEGQVDTGKDKPSDEAYQRQKK